MRIAVLGIGKIGTTLGKKWAQTGHQVTFGVRDPDGPKAQTVLQNVGSLARLDTLSGAIQTGEVVVFAIPGKAVEAVAADQAQFLDGKIVIDATNRFGAQELNSLHTITARAPAAQVFRAFNSLGWENFAEPRFGELQADLLYCGPPGDPDRRVEQLIADVGLRPVRVGDLDQVRLVDVLAELWFALAIGQGMGRRLAFKVLD